MLRLIRLLITESLVVALAGTVLGLLVAWWGLVLLGQLAPMFRIEVTYDVSVDWRVTAFSIVVAVLTVLVCGLLPAAQATRIDLATAMKPTSGVDRSVCARGRCCWPRRSRCRCCWS